MDHFGVLQPQSGAALGMNEEISRLVDSVRHVRHYFESYLPRLEGKLLLKDFESLTCRFDVCLVEGCPIQYRLAITDGRLTAVGDAAGAAQVVYTLDSVTLLDVVTARTTPQDAFYEMRVDIGGEMEVGLELGAVFEEFFRFHPYQLQVVAYDPH